MSKNIILLIGAQGYIDPVEGAVDELYEIETLFRNKAKGQKFQIRRESTITRSILENSLSNLRNDLRILHFAGHSNGKSIHLHDGDMLISPVADYIKSWNQKPYLVFINGCNSAGQIKNFLRIGISCVIATYNPINDEKAKKFAINFYKELLNEQQELSFKIAFEGGSVFLQYTSGYHPRTLDIKDINSIDNKEIKWDWGIFSEKKWEETNSINSIIEKQCIDKKIYWFIFFFLIVILFLFIYMKFHHNPDNNHIIIEGKVMPIVEGGISAVGIKEAKVTILDIGESRLTNNNGTFHINYTNNENFDIHDNVTVLAEHPDYENYNEIKPLGVFMPIRMRPLKNATK